MIIRESSTKEVKVSSPSVDLFLATNQQW